MALSTYYVKLKDLTGAQVAIFAGRGRGGIRGGMRSISYVKKLRYPGEFDLYIDGQDDRISLFEFDSQIEVWRSDPVGGLSWYIDFAGFVRSMEYTQDSDGQDVFVARGRGYNDLLLAESVYGTTGSALCYKTGPVETVLKAYINEAIGPGATLDGLGNSRSMPGLTLEADGATGAAWEGDRMGDNLHDVCLELAEYGPGDYNIVGTGAGTFELQWRLNQWGLDKTLGNGVRPAVVFASQYGNATSFRFLYSKLDEVNAVYVKGQGIGDVRNIQTRVDATALTASPWARRAVSRQGNSQRDTAGLQIVGDQFLNEQKARKKLVFEARQTTATRYGRDWDWGDLVTAIYTKAGAYANLKVVGVRVNVDKEGVESIVPEVEEV